MGKLGFVHIVVSVPRLLIGVMAVGLVVGGAQLVPSSSQATPLHAQTTAQHPAPYTVAPQSASQPPPTPTPIDTAPVPQAVTPVTVTHSSSPAPVITPAASASVSGLTPTAPTANPSGSSSGGSAPPASSPPATTTGYTSTNWSGYLAAAGNYTEIAGSWTVPKATGVNQRSSADATWIGIGGVTASDLIQVGTENSVTPGGTETSAAFYELLPSAAQTITTLSIKPGDTMTASLTEASSGEWQVTISDATTGQSYTTTVTYNSSHSSAEWIEEDPSTTSGRLVPLDIFNPVTFNAATMIGSGNDLSTATGNAQPVTMVTATSQPVAVPSPLGSDGRSFTVTHQ